MKKTRSQKRKEKEKIRRNQEIHLANIKEEQYKNWRLSLEDMSYMDLYAYYFEYEKTAKPDPSKAKTERDFYHELLCIENTFREKVENYIKGEILNLRPWPKDLPVIKGRPVTWVHLSDIFKCNSWESRSINQKSYETLYVLHERECFRKGSKDYLKVLMGLGEDGSQVYFTGIDDQKNYVLPISFMPPGFDPYNFEPEQFPTPEEFIRHITYEFMRIGILILPPGRGLTYKEEPDFQVSWETTIGHFILRYSGAYFSRDHLLFRFVAPNFYHDLWYLNTPSTL
jgi:hypothetical protein